jgi:hypothetical protein
MRFFSDDNGIDEKNVVGLLSFIVMIVFAIVDIILGIVGKEFHITEYIYDSFLIITLGCFGIAGVEKVLSERNKDDSKE